MDNLELAKKLHELRDRIDAEFEQANQKREGREMSFVSIIGRTMGEITGMAVEAAYISREVKRPQDVSEETA